MPIKLSDVAFTASGKAIVSAAWDDVVRVTRIDALDIGPSSLAASTRDRTDLTEAGFEASANPGWTPHRLGARWK